MNADHKHLATVSQWLTQARRAVVFTGAGISTESGIPDFRSPGGVWATNQPVYYEDFLASAEARHEYWRQKSEAHDAMFEAQPNTGHQMLAAWESKGNLRGIITQNIDGLHQRAGNTNVLELHGTALHIICIDCNHQYEAGPLVTDFRETNKVPPCPNCGGRLKHATISFGQSLVEEVLTEAYRWSEEADLMLAIGSSLVVTPAADLPRLAHQSGARLVIINRNSTPLDDLADVVVRESIGDWLQQLTQAYQKQTP